MVVTNKDIKGNKYKKLMTYMTQYCDTIVFQLHNMDKMFDDEIVSGNENVEDVEFEIYDDIELFYKYKNDVENLMKSTGIYADIKNAYESLNYYGNGCNYVFDVYVLSISDNTLSFLGKSTSLYKWCYPSLPEDICFYKNNRCILETITHEKYCFLYTDDAEALKELEKIGLKIDSTYPDKEYLILNDENKVVRIMR